tara:strand:+ start:51 stop:323 length:273 start_codon:yes stop_codon:yes gene_type:complete
MKKKSVQTKLMFFWPAILLVTFLVFIVTLFLVKILWAWTIPDLFPGAVEQGLVIGTLTWFTTFKVALFMAVLTFLQGLLVGHHRCNKKLC